MIYFQLENEPSLIASPYTYVSASIQYTSTNIFSGQIFYTLDTGTTSFPNVPSVSSLYTYPDTNTSVTSISGRGFGVSNFVIKIPPSSLNGYGFFSSSFFLNFYSKFIHSFKKSFFKFI